MEAFQPNKKKKTGREKKIKIMEPTYHESTKALKGGASLAKKKKGGKKASPSQRKGGLIRSPTILE